MLHVLFCFVLFCFDSVVKKAPFENLRVTLFDNSFLFFFLNIHLLTSFCEVFPDHFSAAGKETGGKENNLSVAEMWKEREATRRPTRLVSSSFSSSTSNSSKVVEFRDRTPLGLFLENTNQIKNRGGRRRRGKNWAPYNEISVALRAEM